MNESVSDTSTIKSFSFYNRWCVMTDETRWKKIVSLIMNGEFTASSFSSIVGAVSRVKGLTFVTHSVRKLFFPRQFFSTRKWKQQASSATDALHFCSPNQNRKNYYSKHIEHKQSSIYTCILRQKFKSIFNRMPHYVLYVSDVYLFMCRISSKHEYVIS